MTSAPLYARSVPEHVVLMGVGHMQGRWEADLMARWQSSFLDTRNSPYPGPLQLVTVNNDITVNARIGYRLTDDLTVASVAQH